MNILITPIENKDINTNSPQYKSNTTSIEYECTITSVDNSMSFYIDSLLYGVIKTLNDNKNQTEGFYKAQIQVLQDTLLKK